MLPVPGMGGVWVPDLPSRRVPSSGPRPPPLVWRDLVSFDNPSGSITNSDLELAEVLCHQDDCCELTLATLCDNTPAVAWIKRGSVSNNSSAAYLLRLFALHCRHHRYLTEVSHIPGVLNTMADGASRLWHLSDTAFLSNLSAERIMGVLLTEIEDEFRHDLLFAQEATESGVIPSRKVAARKDWTVWVAFCNSLLIPSTKIPCSPTSLTKVRILQVFAHRVRIGKLARNTGGKPVRSRTVEDYLRSFGQGFTSVGGPDPRHQPLTSQTDFRLKRQLRFYSKQDRPPSRVKPLPLSVLNNFREMAALHGDATSLAVSDLSFAAFYWLLRPGEYCSSSESHPFRLCDVQLFIGEQRLDSCTCALADLDRVTFVTLTFTTQKNGILARLLATPGPLTFTLAPW
jgi:hypothetical protein